MNNYPAIQQELKSEKTLNRICMALDLTAGNDNAKAEARKYAASVLAEIEKSAGSKNDLTACNPHSVAQAMIDAAKFKLMIDGRQHAHLIKYGQSASLQIGYRAYLAKIKEAYPDADFVVTPIYEGDDLEIWDEGGTQNYKLKKKNAFSDGENGLQGILFAVTYTDNGRLCRKVTPVPKSRIDRARGAAKQDFIWKTDYIEKAKAAAIKNACKHFFASLQGLQDIAQYDNEANHDPNKGLKAAPLIENLNNEIFNEPDKKNSLDEDDDSDVIDMTDEEPVVL